MRSLATPEFSNKVATLLVGDRQRLSRLLNEIERAEDSDTLIERLQPIYLGSDTSPMYQICIDDCRVFATIGKDNSGEYLLLMDIVPHRGELRNAVLGTRDPRANYSMNPQHNWAINPDRNWAINPNRNWAINPNRNWAINPDRNWAINPNRNWAINPNRNWAINPDRNWAINPSRNWAIDPARNPAFEGLLVYNLELEPIGFIIPTDGDVSLIFDPRNELQGIAIKNTIDGFSLFDTRNQWFGTLVPDGQGGYLNYSIDSQWIGIIR